MVSEHFLRYKVNVVGSGLGTKTGNTPVEKQSLRREFFSINSDIIFNFISTSLNSPVVRGVKVSCVASWVRFQAV